MDEIVADFWVNINGKQERFYVFRVSDYSGTELRLLKQTQVYRKNTKLGEQIESYNKSEISKILSHGKNPECRNCYGMGYIHHYVKGEYKLERCPNCHPSRRSEQE